MYVYACYIQEAKIICIHSIFVTNQVFILRLRWLKGYFFMITTTEETKQLEPSMYSLVYMCIVFYARVP